MSTTMPKREHRPVLVFGAGAIGLYLGGRLALAGQAVHFVGRPRIVAALREDGLQVATIDGTVRRLPGEQVQASSSIADAPSPSLVLLTVKGHATRDAAGELQAALPAGTPVLSLQNGVDNLARLRAAAPSLHAMAGMVPFNVVMPGPNHVAQATSGRLAAQRCAVSEHWQPCFAAAGLPLDLHDDMQSVMWGKLLLNLNNPLNALCGLPLLQQLQDRRFRMLLARLQDEALAAMHAAGIRPARVTPLPSAWLPALLRLPTPLFRQLARRMLSIDPQARLSMHADRVQGRPTEVDDLCGAVQRLAAAHGLDASANRVVQRLVETTPRERFLDAAALQAALDAAQT